MSSIVLLKPIVESKRALPDLQAIINSEVRKEANRVINEYHQTTRTWRTRPDFEILQDDRDGEAIIGTDNLIYKFLDEGTRPHTIKPKASGYPLRFKWAGRGTYRAKTAVRFIGSRAGGNPSNAPTVRRMSVQHPGTKARRFTEVIQRRSQRRLPKNIRKAIKRQIGKPASRATSVR